MNNLKGTGSETNVKSSGQQVIIPYPKRAERHNKTILVEINSRDRNIVSYPMSSLFRWKFFRPLKDVISIQIAGGTVPACMYNLNTGWNSFTFQEGSKKYNITISPGRYNYESLVIALASVLTAVSGGTNTYSVDIDTTNGRLTINRLTGITSFGLLFLTGDYVDYYDNNNTLQKINTPAKLFGFGRFDYFDNGTGKITAPNIVDLDFLTTRLYLYINNDNTQDLNTVERSVGRQQPHAILYADQLRDGYKFLNKETFEPLYSSFPAPIARMANLDIALRDEFDRIADLNGRDFTILLEVTYLD